MKTSDHSENALYRSFCSNLKSVLDNHTHKQEVVARAMGTSASHISEKLNCRTKIDLLWLMQLCYALDIKPSQLFDLKQLDIVFLANNKTTTPKETKVITLNKRST